jgi:hypothetical protein
MASPFGGGGDRVAYVLSGNRVDDHGMNDLLGTIPVVTGGVD